MSVLEPAARLQLTTVLVFFALFGFFTYPDSGSGAASSTIDFDSSVTLLNDLPNVTSLYLNGGNPIILTPATTTDIYVSFNIQDDNGCGDVFFNGTTSVKVFRSGVGSSCTPDGKNCYIATLTSHACPSATSATMGANATATVAIQFYADATDASSTNSGDTWQVYVSATDEAAGTHSTTTNPGVELNTLLAIDLDKSSIDYGQLELGQNTGSNNQSTTIDNVGNSKLNIKVHGTAMTSGGDSVATSSQHYATTSFTYGVGDNSLSDVASFINGLVMSKLNGPIISYLASTTAWTFTTAMPVPRYDSAAVRHGDWLYLIAGRGSGAVQQSSTLSGQINENGTISWSVANYFPHVASWLEAGVVGSKIYVINGYFNSTPTSTVFVADINGDHSLSSWTYGLSTPQPCYVTAIAVYGDYIYRTGGACPGATSTVIYSRVSATGTLNWTSTQSLPNSFYSHSAVVSDGYIYVLGGYAAGVVSTTVRFSQINGSDGSLGPWIQTASLPYALDYPDFVAQNGNIYLAGSDNPTSSVYYAPINATGSLGQWRQIESMPISTDRHELISDSETLYQIGGSITSTVSYAKFVTSTIGGPSTSTIYWGASAPSDADTGNYTSSITYTAVWAP